MSDGIDQGEKCQRCGEVGEDRRTLWHACFYDMSETGVPFNFETAEHTEGEQPAAFYTLIFAAALKFGGLV